jgi:hypothetical protein
MNEFVFDSGVALLAALIGGIIVALLQSWHAHVRELVADEWEAGLNARRILNRLIEKHRYCKKRLDQDPQCSGLMEFYNFACEEAEGKQSRVEQLDDAIFGFIDFLHQNDKQTFHGLWAGIRHALIETHRNIRKTSTSDVLPRFDAIDSSMKQLQPYFSKQRSRRWWGLIRSDWR